MWKQFCILSKMSIITITVVAVMIKLKRIE